MRNAFHASYLFHQAFLGLTVHSRRVSARSDQQVSVRDLAPPITLYYPSPRKTRSKARLNDGSKSSGGSQQKSFPTSSRSDASDSVSNEDDEDVEQPGDPSPRRLRRRSNATQPSKEQIKSSASSRPRRRARFQGSFREESDAEEDELEDDTLVVEQDSTEEQDELQSDDDAPVSAASSGNRRGSKGSRKVRVAPPTDTKRPPRLRNGRQTHPPLSNGDELEDESELSDPPEIELEEVAEEEEEDVEEEDAEPKVLRNGKVLGGSQASDDESEDIGNSSQELEESSMEIEEEEEVQEDDELEDESEDVEDPEDQEYEPQADNSIDSMSVLSLHLIAQLKHIMLFRHGRASRRPQVTSSSSSRLSYPAL